jgi:hypothetical protein
MKTYIFVLVVLAVFLSAALANAAIKLKDYDQYKNSFTFKEYMAGVGEGFRWANSWIDKDGSGSKLYCQTEKLTLTHDDYLRILDYEIKGGSAAYQQDDPVELILLKALQHKFPCNDKGNRSSENTESNRSPRSKGNFNSSN